MPRGGEGDASGPEASVAGPETIVAVSEVLSSVPCREMVESVQ
jgi:hypothetical protein